MKIKLAGETLRKNHCYIKSSIIPQKTVGVYAERLHPFFINSNV